MCLYEQQEHILKLQNSNHKNDWFDILYWQSNPCIVIGRFQNVWNEAQMASIRSKQLDLARRYSGGGTVYHDLGNLNICFMRSRHALNRLDCMEFLKNTIQSLLFDKYLEVCVGSRHDLWISKNKNLIGSFKQTESVCVCVC